MLNPMLPDEVAVTTIPRQKFIGLRQIFVMNQFQGLSLVPKLHFLAQVLNVVWNTLLLLEAFRYGDAEEIIAAVIVYPIFMIYFACIVRVLSEIAISVLLVPGLLAKANAGPGAAAAAAVQSINAGDNADLAAYGVHVSDDGGTIV
eukprot:g13657.t1